MTSLNTYIVTAYSLKGTPAYEGRKTEIEAPTAEEAVHLVLNGHQYASRTKRLQNDPDPVVRDNAHFQRDPNGFCGAYAVRK